MPSSYRFIVHGRVQGVFFRQTAVEQARAQQLRGWVRNREDGAVEGQAQGEPRALESFRAWLAQGPPSARVTSVEWVPDDPDPSLQGFRIRP